MSFIVLMHDDYNDVNDDKSKNKDEENDDIEFACPALPRMRRGVRAVEATCKEGSGSHVMGSRMMMMMGSRMNISMVCVVLEMMASKGGERRW